MSNNDVSRQKLECRKFADKIRSMFPDIEVISSDDFVSMEKGNNSNNKIVLVDVRTKAERDVSVVEGSVPLSELNVPKLMAEANTLENDDGGSNKHGAGIHLVTYCTVGFRACIEARQLKKEYPSLKVSSLDGIACYTHEAAPAATQHGKWRRIVEPATGEPRNVVHTYGSQWAGVVNGDTYEATHFSAPAMAAYNLQFGASLAWKLLKKNGKYW